MFVSTKLQIHHAKTPIHHKTIFYFLYNLFDKILSNNYII